MNQYAKIVRSGETDARVKVGLFGQAHAVVSDGGKVKIPRMGLVLAAFLLLDCSSMRASREEAARFLWEDLDRDRQAGNLRQLLLRLRTLQTIHDMRLFAIHGDQIALHHGGVDIDVCAFRASTAGNSEQRIAAICEAYSGDLLGGVHVDGEKLSHWLATRRAQLRTEFVDAILPYLEDQRRSPNSVLAGVAAKRLIAAEPFHEAGYRALMRTYAKRGDVAAVHRLYERLERLLAKERGCKPSPLTHELYQTLSNKARRPAPILTQPFVHEAGEKAASSPSALFAARAALPRLAILAPMATGSSATSQELVDYFVFDLATRLSQTRSFVITLPEPAFVGVRSPATFDFDYLVDVRARQGAANPATFVRLLATSTREILWAACFDNADDFSNDIQTAVLSIVRHIESRETQILDGAVEAKSAYVLTVRGRRLLRNIDLPAIRRARNLFKTALAIAPAYVPAMAGLSRSHVMEWLVRAPFEQSALETAEQCARKAISICPDDYRGHHELGLVKLYLKRLDKSVETLGCAKTLNPHDMDVHTDLADALVFNGRAGEAIQLFAQSKQLCRPNDDYVHWILAGAHFHSGEYRASLDEIARMKNTGPAFRISAAAHALLGEHQHARRIVAASMEFNPEFNLNLWLSMYPCRNHEYIQRYSDGLRQAGFQ